MTAVKQPLRDDAARRRALTEHDRAQLVEAGAGSGKTAVMAGRVAMMLADGVEPRHIAAVTFTELAASQLVYRVRAFVDALVAGHIPVELRVALPEGLSKVQRQNLEAASLSIDQITCSTIHGFCQRLIKPYPVEADIDPGASVMDPGEAALVFGEIVEAWLREELSAGTDGLLAEVVLADPDQAVALIQTILGQLRTHRRLSVNAPEAIGPGLEAFQAAAAGFLAFVDSTTVDEPDSRRRAECFAEMADTLDPRKPDTNVADLVHLLTASPHAELCTQKGFKAFQTKTKWVKAAGTAGYSKADGEQLFATAEGHYNACRTAWEELLQVTAARVLAEMVDIAEPVLARFRDHKRATAVLDFDDLIFSARDLLRDHENVRQALGRRFAHVLVDEFQDTDPLQTEIFWRLCGEPSAGESDDDWRRFRIRPGALFLVGDPKQAIYRFRGADVATYVEARDLLLGQDPASVLSISTNFRSCAPILTHVNERFEQPLSEENGQPGFTQLDSFIPAPDAGPCVTCLDVAVADETGKASAERMRDGEADAVADLCLRLIGSRTLADEKTSQTRLCRPGDIALLAPIGTELWRYERALEDRGIPVATQAGKGFYRRQEVQDLIAMTRALADPRDRLALGALLRGPLVGLTEEELLDIVWALPRPADAPESLPRLDLRIDPQHIAHDQARAILETLQALRRNVNATTPHNLLSQAVDQLRLRPILLQRHRGQAERALANVDLYLNLSRAYAVRGLRAFAEAMTKAWEEGEGAVEGRPDAQEEAIALYTMHAAKGLEWPIVVPVNTMGATRSADGAIVDRTSGRLFCPVFGVRPTGYDMALADENAELDRERVRLWYVAATRARELLILPRLDVARKASAWISVVELGLDDLAGLDVSDLPPEVGALEAEPENAQTREVFASEAAAIAEQHRHIHWRVPSREEGSREPTVADEEPEILATDLDGTTVATGARAVIRGGRERGIILHKLIEEVLTGETEETVPEMTARAEALIRTLGLDVAEDLTKGLVPCEVAGSAARALALPEVAALRPRLVPEFPVYASSITDGEEELTAGTADAIAFGPNSEPLAVVDWKSDVDPNPETLEHYRAQVRAYLDMTDIDNGLVILATSGVAIPVERTGAAADSQGQ